MSTLVFAVNILLKVDFVFMGRNLIDFVWVGVAYLIIKEKYFLGSGWNLFKLIRIYIIQISAQG